MLPPIRFSLFPDILLIFHRYCSSIIVLWFRSAVPTLCFAEPSSWLHVTWHACVNPSLVALSLTVINLQTLSYIEPVPTSTPADWPRWGLILYLHTYLQQSATINISSSVDIQHLFHWVDHSPPPSEPKMLFPAPCVCSFSECPHFAFRAGLSRCQLLP